MMREKNVIASTTLTFTQRYLIAYLMFFSLIIIIIRFFFCKNFKLYFEDLEFFFLRKIIFSWLASINWNIQQVFCIFYKCIIYKLYEFFELDRNLRLIWNTECILCACTGQKPTGGTVLLQIAIATQNW